MIGNLLPYLKKIRRSNQSNDIVDRLNYQYTTALVSFAAITLAGTQYIGKPIQCWVPYHFSDEWEKYAETICFVCGSYFLPENETTGAFLMEAKRDWVPLMLAFQAFLFYLPWLVWKSLNSSSENNVEGVLENSALIKKKLKADVRKEVVVKAAAHIKEALEIQRDLKQNAGLTGRIRKSGYFFTLLYLFTNLLFISNIVVQFFIFKQFLGTESTWWGWDIFMRFIAGDSWKEIGHFPRVTFCDFKIRQLGIIHFWNLQCVLMINMYTEKFWFFFIGCVTVCSFLYYILALLIRANQVKFVEKYLRCLNCTTNLPTERSKIDSFVHNFLSADGVFLLRLVQENGADMLLEDVLAALYQKWSRRDETFAVENTSENAGNDPSIE